jgi:hypothetical protein
VTVIPFDGSAPLAPLPGAIVTTGPAGVGFADAFAAEALFAADVTAVVPLLVHPASAMPSTASAATPPIPMRLIEKPIPTTPHTRTRSRRLVHESR